VAALANSAVARTSATPSPSALTAPATAPIVAASKPEPAAQASAASTNANKVANDEANAEPPFDASAAEAAIGAAAARAASCKKPGDPSGVAVVTVTFSTSGRATTANVAGEPFAGTATGGCIAATLRAARVPAFSGDFVTVKKSVKID
jgi:hypothetical protein